MTSPVALVSEDDMAEEGMLTGARILVLDDEKQARTSLGRVLETQGAEVDVFATAEEVLPILPIYDFDAAIVDYWLPGRVGTDIVKILRAAPRPCASVVVTGTRDPSLTQECVELGAFEVLIKPFELSDFLQAALAATDRTRRWRIAIDDGPKDHVGDRRFRTHGEPLLAYDPEFRIESIRAKLDENARHVGKAFDLSDRELETLRLLVQGLDTKEMADQMKVALRTVKYHISNTNKKLGLRGRARLLLFVLLYEPKSSRTPPPGN